MSFALLMKAACACAFFALEANAQQQADDATATLTHWDIKEGAWTVEDGHLQAKGGFASVLWCGEGDAKAEGFNMAQVYLHWIVWDTDGAEYLRKIDDFLARAAKHGLKVNLIFWDDCGHVEPALTFAPPIPGRHIITSQKHSRHEQRPLWSTHSCLMWCRCDAGLLDPT
ncbi:MAG: hypothetical protein ACO1TE_18665 [Prosthecobacter sp.]